MKVTDNVLQQHCAPSVNFTEAGTAHDTVRVYNSLWLARGGYGLLLQAAAPEIVKSVFVWKSFQVLVLFSIPFIPTFPAITSFVSLAVNPLKNEKKSLLFPPPVSLHF